MRYNWKKVKWPPQTYKTCRCILYSNFRKPKTKKNILKEDNKSTENTETCNKKRLRKKLQLKRKFSKMDDRYQAT